MTDPEIPALQRPQFSEAAAALAERQLAALQQEYPDWTITCVADLAEPIWYAILRTTLTERQRATGACQTLMRSSAEALASALFIEVELVRKMRQPWQRFIP
jgi:hypothetical protein